MNFKSLVLSLYNQISGANNCRLGTETQDFNLKKLNPSHTHNRILCIITNWTKEKSF
jgi:hypothetical protein